MREAIGGSMLMYIVIPIVILFIVFVAFVMNYAAAYRSANYLVTQIETCQGEMGGCGHTDFSKMETFIKEHYHYLSDVSYSCSANSRGAVWTVSLNVTMEFPILGEIGIYKVKAETKTMYGATC